MGNYIDRFALKGGELKNLDLGASVPQSVDLDEEAIALGSCDRGLY